MNTTPLSELRWHHLVIVLIATTALTGCRNAGFSMPGKNLFTWNRQPNAATLAGNAKVPELPESPATKYDPSAIASVGAKSPSTSDLATNPASGSAYGYTGTASKAGLAASANGYQTGPYQVAPNGSPATSTVASTSSGANLPNPYGGTYAGFSTAPNTGSSSLAGMPLPNAVAGARPNATDSFSGYPSGYGGNGGLPAPSATATAVSYVNPPNPGSTQTATSAPAYPAPPSYPANQANAVPPVPSHQLPQSASVGGALATAVPTYPNLPGAGYAQPSAASAGASSAPSAYTGTTTLSGYSPGSTGRSTSYDFSNRATPPESSGTSTTLPPNTATGTLPLLR